MKWLTRTIHFLHRGEDAALISALLLMLGLAILQIVLRNFFSQGFLWAETFLRILVLWVAMLGAMVATREGNHISIDVLKRYLPASSYRWVAVMTSAISAVVCGLVAWHAIELVQFEYEDQTIAFASVPTWLCQSILPVGFAIMALRFASGSLRQLLVAQ